jgi:hypothetical protein
LGDAPDAEDRNGNMSTHGGGLCKFLKSTDGNFKAVIVYSLDKERQLRPYEIQVVMKPDFDMVFHRTGWGKSYGKSAWNN